MEKLILNNNVYIVQGAKYDCIYDLNHRYLYHINHNTAGLLYKVITGKTDQKYSAQEEKMIHQFLECGFLVDEDGSIEKLITIKDDHCIRKVWIEITQKCNFNCIHCYEGEKQAVEMSLSDIKHIIDQLELNSVKELQIIGGEPMLHSRFLDILDYCSGKFELISVFTNGTLISSDIIERLKKLNATVYVSLHANKEEDFDKITRSKGMYAKVLKNIESLRDSGLKTIIKRCEFTGVDSANPCNRKDEGGFPVLVGNANINQYSMDMLKRKVVSPSSFEEQLNVHSVLENMTMHHCFRDRIYIDVKQDVYPCVLERRIKHGNIRNNELCSIINTSIKSITKDHVDECKNCEYRYACNTCFPDTMSSWLYAKPWFCTYKPEEGKWISVEELAERLGFDLIGQKAERGLSH